ncbi:hypothetical protein BDF19DRAFT_456656 [Syncephalis fuscata]|nr:hypothetical protein BDF19DRAFT_456656 [Syncephalis fuscata]
MVVTRRGTDTEQASPNTSADEYSATDYGETTTTSNSNNNNSNSSNNNTVDTQRTSNDTLGTQSSSPVPLAMPTPLALPSATSPVFAATPERIAAESVVADSEDEEDEVNARIEENLTHPEMENRQFRDLLVFEERLRQNATRLRGEQQRSEMLLGGLVLISAILGWFAMIRPSENAFIRIFVKCLLLASIISMLVLCYSESMTQASRFLPQCNRALVSINLQLGAHGLQFHRSVPRRLREGYAAFRDAYHQRRRVPTRSSMTTNTTVGNTTPRRRNRA